MSSIQQLIEKEINEIEGGIKILEGRKVQLEQALALVTNASLETLEAIAAKKAPAPKVTPQRTAKKKGTGTSISTKARATWKHNSMPWKPAPHAKPHTQHIYDFLADGTSRSTQEILDHVQTTLPETSLMQVSSALSHMHGTGRLMYAKKKWRRKYARQVTKVPTSQQAIVSVEQIPESQRSEAVTRLDSLVAEGKLTKIERASGNVYAPAKAVGN